MIHGDIKGVCPREPGSFYLPLMGFVYQANILIDQAGHARLADFGLLTITLDVTNATSSNSFIPGGTWRCMSPELFDPEKFDLKDSRQTKFSDCYALGMVIYEVLSGRVPFSRHHGPAIIGAIIKGERPGRPRGERGTWFTDGIWGTLERCWKPDPSDRPSIEDVLQHLEGASRSWTPPSLRTVINPAMTSPAQNSDPSTEQSMDESEMSPPSQAVTPRPSQEFPLKGDLNALSVYPSPHKFSAPPHAVPGYQGPDTSVINADGSDPEKSAGFMDRVSWASVLDGFWS